MIIKFIAGKKMLCAVMGVAVVAPPVIIHKIDRRVAKVEKRVAVRNAIAATRRERPAYRVERKGVVATDFKTLPVAAEVAAQCVPYGGLSGGGGGGLGGATGGYIGIGGDVIGIGHTPPPGNGITPAVPEPSGWALMILGFGLMGTNMRSIRRDAKREGGAA